MSEYIFKGVYIPSAVWLDDRLTPTQKMLLCEIDAMSNGKKNPCFASNGHFAAHLQISVGTVRNHVMKLKKLGYVLTSYKDDKTHYGRSIWTNLHPSSDNDTPSSDNDTPSSDNDTPSSDNDTSINKPLNQLLIQEEEEEDYKNNVDNYITFITENYKGVKNKTAYKNKILENLKKNDKRTLESYKDFLSSGCPTFESINPIQIFLKVLEETNREDFAYLEASKGLSYKEQDELSKFREDLLFQKMIDNRNQKKDIKNGTT